MPAKTVRFQSLPFCRVIVLGIVAIIISGLMSACTLSYGGVDTKTDERIIESTEEQETTAANEILHNLSVDDDAVVIRLSQKQECYERTINRVEDVEQRSIAPFFPLMDLVGGGLTIAGGGVYMAVGPPLEESEPRDVGLSLMVLGGAFAAVGSYYLIRYPEEELLETRTVERDWQSFSCDDLPLRDATVTVDLSDAHLLDGEPDSMGTFNLPIPALEDAFLAHQGGIPQLRLTIDADFLDDSFQITALVPNDLVSLFEEERQHRLLEHALEGGDVEAAVDFVERYPGANSYENVLDVVSNSASKSTDLGQVLDMMRAIGTDNETHFEDVRQRAIELLLDRDSIDDFHRYFTTLDGLGEHPFHIEILESYSEKWVNHALEFYIKEFEENGVDELPSPPSEAPSWMSQSNTRKLLPPIHEYHLERAREARRSAYNSVAMDDAREAAIRFTLAIKYSLDDEVRASLQDEINEFANSFRRRQRASWSSRKQEAMARCRPARDNVRRTLRQIQQLSAQGRFEEAADIEDDLERYVEQVQEAGGEVAQISQEMQMTGIRYDLPGDSYSRYVEWDDDEVSEQRIIETLRKLQANCST